MAKPHSSARDRWHDGICDVKNEYSVRSTIEQVASVLEGIDVLINNAGEIVVGPLDAIDFFSCFTRKPGILMLLRLRDW